MGKVKIKKADVWIDMTPMSDVMVLLLTFFMLTSTFVKNEAVKVNTPGSIMETKVPENNVLSILIDKHGKVFLGMDKPGDFTNVLTTMTDQFGIQLNGQQLETFRTATNVGVPMDEIPALLSLDDTKLNEYMATKGIPTDSIEKDGQKGMSEFQLWVQAARDNNGPDMKLALKADADTPYGVVKKVMSELQDMSENRYYLITSYKKQQED
ncbi:MAG: biopolymer transporter ExbD [Bacteroidales bacterium]|nr:biopolymer transporter ExbD [Bacteroidales bacterium]MDY2693210.1 biopolymer transporter ExbD [Prevotella sp.]MDD5787550.1 biopolymer transporter ExbD [Bacteroidales bacterium]MDD6897989.1 biopolymer transporter ExbD [Bacteroidales bacterium]MDY4732403.1 biopolymer transporter ExbD [Prevotella sp.]